jgi:hypothetical protein
MKPRVAGGECHVSCNCIVSCESCVQPSEHWLKNDKKLPEQYVLRERRRERNPKTNHPSRPRERRLHRGPPPAIVLATGGRRAKGRARGEGEAYIFAVNFLLLDPVALSIVVCCFPCLFLFLFIILTFLFIILIFNITSSTLSFECIISSLIF